MRSAAVVPFLFSGLHILVTRANPVKRTISETVYDDLVFYFQYASSAYSTTCASPNGNTLVTEFSDTGTDTQGFIARDDTREEIVVALRGSSSAEDFLTDVELVLEDFVVTGTSPPDGTTAHTGFLNAWNAVVDTVLSEVTSQLSDNPGYAIVTSGHSLGGALSSLAAITLQQNFPSSIVRMYTYGQPRTGNDDYAFWVNDEIGSNAFRVVHTTDGVPTIIPTSLGYRHHGIEYWQNPDPPSADTTTECAADGEDPTCSASIPSGGIDAAHTEYFDILAITPFCS
ncbi:alpha/beta-hydrolase [Stereum hirsutum FP-91666 SS1]|uniref:alpha/beta-hydrolase n=1 Tax=Stereum hirsutum (strain FP-91666) TaxID=721885 RepID=UPI000440CE81|nr:alpha/beta-hydrolase [Stereum hirsutum FP-91666 SS1]EIM86754.1 alpha/beta-hydrolase [Stereum hirsutum FP-91666 SS1]